MAIRKTAAKAGARVDPLTPAGMGLIEDKATLFKAIDAARRQRNALAHSYHVLAVSSLLHLSKHGQIDVLNRFYDSLDAAHQTNLRVYVGYLCGEGTTAKTLPEGKGWIAATTGKEKQNGFFKVINDRMDARKEFEKNVKSVFDCIKVELGGVERKPEKFFDIKVSASDLVTVGNDDVLKRIDSMIATFTKGSDDKRKIAVSPEMVAILKSAQREAQALVQAGRPEGNLIQ